MLRHRLNARRIWESTLQIVDYMDFADCADFKNITVCRGVIHCASGWGEHAKHNT